MILPTAMLKDHLDQERKNLQSTKLEDPSSLLVIDPRHLDAKMKTRNVIASLEPMILPGKAFSDLTGRFPRRSS